MKTIYLIRHGHTDNSGIFDSSSTVSLNAQGKQAVQTLTQSFHSHPIDAIYTSPMRRCIETTEILFPSSALPFHTEKDLQEIKFGSWEGKTYSMMQKEHPNYLEQLIKHQEAFTFPEGENVSLFHQRVWNIFEKICRTRTKHIAIITHKGVIETILCRILNISPIFPPLIISPASCSIVLLENDTWTIKSISTSL